MIPKLALTLLAGGITLASIGAPCATAQTFTSHGEPSADEQFMLELINAARANPAATGEALATTADPEMLASYRYYGVDTGLLRGQFATYASRPPLAFHPALIAAARAHTADMVAHSYSDHLGTDGSFGADRARAAGYPGVGVAECCGGPIYGAGAYNSFEQVALAYLVDWGVPSLGHRFITLDVDRPRPAAVEMGVGCGEGYANTQEFGYYYGPAPHYLTGVAYRDRNANGRYDQGEGLAGVTITVEGNSTYTVTGQSGGYAVRLDRTGAIRARATGGLLGDLSVPLDGSTNGDNVKWDLVWGANGEVPRGAGLVNATVSVGGDASRGGFVLTRMGDVSAPLPVFYHVGGGAFGGVDYDTLSGAATFEAGQAETLIPVVAHTRHSKVKVFLDSGAGYVIGKAQSKVVLADMP